MYKVQHVLKLKIDLSKNGTHSFLVNAPSLPEAYTSAEAALKAMGFMVCDSRKSFEKVPEASSTFVLSIEEI